MDENKVITEEFDIEEILLENGYEGIKYLTNDSYDTAVIGVSSTDQVIYDYDKMVDWLVEKDSISAEEAMEWIDYNVIRALPYMSPGEPIIMYNLTY